VTNVDAIVGDIKEIYIRFKNTADRIIMNLPKSSYLFLREALRMLKPERGIIHFYALESAYSAENERKSESLDRAIEQAKERLMTTIQELDAEFVGYSMHIREARKVKAYAPYAYIVGVDVEMRRREEILTLHTDDRHT
jgi:tRNA G37 N-methylase Trm5